MAEHRLLELLVTIAAPRASPQHVHWQLRDRGDYPPPQDIGPNRVRVESPVRPLADGSRALDPRAIGGLMSAETPLWPGPGDRNLIPELATALLPEPDDPLLRRFADPQDSSLRRVALDAPEPFAGLPWEDLVRKAGMGAPMVVYRSDRPASEHSVPLDLPIDVRVQLATRCVESGLSEGLFDEFTRKWGIDQGLFAVDEGTKTPRGGEVHHIVWSSSEGTGAIEAVLRRRARTARLLVLHDVEAALHPGALAGAISACLERGTDAVLVVAVDPAPPGKVAFVPAFYRNLLHNRPIDLSRDLALQEHEPGSRLVTLLGLREGGEFGLLLTRALTEPVVMARPRRREVPRAARRRGSKLRHDGLDLLLTRRIEIATDAFERTESFDFDAEETAAAEVRADRERIDEELELVEEEESLLEDLDELHAVTFRTTNVWITEGVSDTGPAIAEDVALVAEDVALVAGDPYRLHVNIGRLVEGALLAERFPEEELAEIFEREESVRLDVAVFSPDFDVESAPPQLELPRVGDSNVSTVGIVARRAGRARLRIGIYHRNVMLQSLMLELDVVTGGASRSAMEPARGAVDYLATGNPAELEELQPAALNLFVNAAGDGTHWIGVFHDDDQKFGLRSGALRTFHPGALEIQTNAIRKRLTEIEGPQRKYRYDKAWSEVPSDTNELERREARLVDLARTGWKAFASLLTEEDDETDAQELHTLSDVHGESLVSIARCKGTSPGMPWAALYDRFIDTDESRRLALCPVFKAQVLANEWSPEGTLETKHDLLDDPAACRAQDACPLSGPNPEGVVCPFGFWGFAHQVEQPLQHVGLDPAGGLPEYARDPRFTQSSCLLRDTDEPRTLMAVWPGIPDVNEHHDAVAGLGLEVDYRDDRNEIFDLVYAGGHHFYYFYCHGEFVESEFRLKLGPKDKPGYITHDNLARYGARWPPPSSLVVINGCETLAITPEVSHELMHGFRRLGASGVVGTEIKVWTELAAPFGEAVLRRMLEGSSLGEAFLMERRQLLRELNPLGLAYSFYAPAALHLHSESGDAECGWCAARQPGRPPRTNLRG